MSRCILVALVLGSLLATPTQASWKSAAHFVSLPIIEGTGIYSSVIGLRDGELGVTKAAGVTNLALLGTNATFGMLSKMGPMDSRAKLHKIHRFIGFGVTAAALWLSISASLDNGINGRPSGAQYTSYAYTGLTVVPLILFAF
jgi:hypothetical protein